MKVNMARISRDESEKLVFLRSQRRVRVEMLLFSRTLKLYLKNVGYFGTLNFFMFLVLASHLLKHAQTNKDQFKLIFKKTF